MLNNFMQATDKPLWSIYNTEGKDSTIHHSKCEQNLIVVIAL